MTKLEEAIADVKEQIRLQADDETTVETASLTALLEATVRPRTLQERMDAAPEGATVYSASQGRRYIKYLGGWCRHHEAPGSCPFYGCPHSSVDGMEPSND